MTEAGADKDTVMMQRLTRACQTAHRQFQEKFALKSQGFADDPRAEIIFSELEGFVNPLFSKLAEEMAAASTLEQQQELLLQMMRQSFYECMMISGNDMIAAVSNEYIRGMINAYTAQLPKSGHTRKTLADPGGIFQAMYSYGHLLNGASEEIEQKPADIVRRRLGILPGGVSQEQRQQIAAASEKSLRPLVEPFIAPDAPFQPDMVALVAMLAKRPENVFEIMQRGPGTKNSEAPPATMKLWLNLQRDYPAMATNVTELVNAALALNEVGRVKGTKN